MVDTWPLGAGVLDKEEDPPPPQARMRARLLSGRGERRGDGSEGAWRTPRWQSGCSGSGCLRWPRDPGEHPGLNGHSSLLPHSSDDPAPTVDPARRPAPGTTRPQRAGVADAQLRAGATAWRESAWACSRSPFPRRPLSSPSEAMPGIGGRNSRRLLRPPMEPSARNWTRRSSAAPASR